MQVWAAHLHAWVPALILAAAALVAAWPGRRDGDAPLDGTTGNGRAAGLATLSGLAALCALAVLAPLFGGWLAGLSHPNAIGGLLPWNDAAGYYNCALSVLDGGKFGALCERRPAYPVYLAGLLALGGYGLQPVLVLQAVLSGLAAFAVAAVVRARWGLAAALASVAVAAAFAATVSTTTLTENAGLVLGSAGIALLLAGAAAAGPVRLAAGAFLLAVALNARAGAFVVLPLLLAWPLLAVGLDRRRHRRLSAAALAGVIGGFIPGYLLGQSLGAGDGTLHANFAYTLYGLVAGGERWTHAVAVLTPPGGAGPATGFVYRAATELFAAQPHLLALGLAQGMLEHVQRLLTWVAWAPARVAITACWLWGLAGLLRQRRDEAERLTLLLTLGVLASAPVIAIEGDTRVFAATTALDGIVAGIGLARLREAVTRWRGVLLGALLVLPPALAVIAAADDLRAWGVAIVFSATIALAARPPHPAPAGRASAGRASAGRASAGPAWAVAAAAAALVTAVPYGARALHGFPDARLTAARAALPCPAGERALFARPGRDSPVLRLVAPGEANSAWPVTVAVAQFRAGLSPLTAHHDALAALPAGTALVLARDIAPPPGAPRRADLLVGPVDAVPADGGTHRLCITAAPAGPLPDARAIRSVAPLE